MFRRVAAPVFALALLAAAAPAIAADPGPVVQGAWARPTTSQATAAGAFLTIRNAGPADRLVGGSSPVADKVELHTHVMEGAIARMREVEGGIALPAGETVALKPGGLHVMLIGLKRPLKAGETFPLTLGFEKAGSTSITVTVAEPGKEPTASGHGAGTTHGH